MAFDSPSRNRAGFGYRKSQPWYVTAIGVAVKLYRQRNIASLLVLLCVSVWVLVVVAWRPCPSCAEGGIVNGSSTTPAATLRQKLLSPAAAATPSSSAALARIESRQIELFAKLLQDVDAQGKPVENKGVTCDLSPPVFWSDSPYRGNSLEIKADTDEMPPNFGGTSSIRFAKHRPGCPRYVLEIFSDSDFRGSHMTVSESLPFVEEWNDWINSVKVTLLPAASAASPSSVPAALMRNVAAQEMLIIVHQMNEVEMAANIRAIDLAQTLQRQGHSVYMLSAFGCYCPEFDAILHSQQGVNPIIHVCGADDSRDRFDIVSFLAPRNFHSAFLYFWVWDLTSVPETFTSTLRQFSPNTALVVLTDDAHSEREHRLGEAFLLFPHLRMTGTYHAYFDPRHYLNVQQRELEVYRYADVVVTLTDADAQTLQPFLEGMDSPPNLGVLHWHHNLTGFPIPSIEKQGELPDFDQRDGIVFVGYGDNPTNRISMEWFFKFVSPLLPPSMANMPIVLAGREPHDKFRSLNTDGRKITVTGKQTQEQFRTLLKSTKLMISPIIASTGLNTKNVLGLASGIPVLTTSLGAQGLRWAGVNQFVDGGFAIADQPADYAAKLISLYTNAEEWRAQLKRGLALISAVYASTQFDEDLKEIVRETDQLRRNTAKQTEAERFRVFKRGLAPGEGGVMVSGGLKTAVRPPSGFLSGEKLLQKALKYNWMLGTKELNGDHVQIGKGGMYSVKYEDGKK